ncbi:MAG: hypothetical protein H0W63_08440 [Gemmatimonadaceae bacterium]|nr:hypothetical protein [Gemmatimonadaceae bacterium]
MRGILSKVSALVVAVGSAVVITLAFASCGSDSTAPSGPSGYLITIEQSSLIAGQDLRVKAQLVDAQGKNLSIAGRNVRWASSNGGRFVYGALTTDASGSVAVLFTPQTVAGLSYQLTATDESGALGNSAPFQTVPGPATKYIVTASAQSAPVGSTITISAQLADANRNLVAVAGREITWKKNTAEGSFSASTSVTNAAGIGSVNFTLGTTANLSTSLTAFDPVATGSVFVLTTAGPAAQLGVSASETDPPVGAGVTIRAQPQDAFSNPVRSSGITVTWAVTGTGGTLSSPTSVTGDSGYAVVIFTGDGAPGVSYTVTATAAGASGKAVVTTTQPVGLAYVSTGGASTCGTSSAGVAWCWGANGLGQLGDGTYSDRAIPGRVAGGLTFVAIATGSNFGCGIVQAGTAYCWGNNASGQLGDNTLLPHNTPKPVTGSVAFKSLSAGGGHVCGVAINGDAYCWGANSAGQLGIGTRAITPVPMKVSGGFEWASISAGDVHTCGIASSGTGYCWGSNNYYQLGDKAPPRSTPGALAGAFSALSAGRTFTCGVKDGAGYCWGYNGFGQLGTNGAVYESNPTKIVLPASITLASIAAGDSHACAITVDGVAYCWGDNRESQLGNGTRAKSTVPVLVTTGERFTSISASGTETFSNSYYADLQSLRAHSCGITTAGVAYCWGSNASGQLGFGRTIFDSSKPVKVAGQR